MKPQDTTTNSPAPIVSLTQFCRSAGISQITAWRFRQRGWLETTNIAGRQYCTSEQIAKFKRRATAGEFAQEHKVPTRAGGGC